MRPCCGLGKVVGPVTAVCHLLSNPIQLLVWLLLLCFFVYFVWAQLFGCCYDAACFLGLAGLWWEGGACVEGTQVSTGASTCSGRERSLPRESALCWWHLL